MKRNGARAAEVGGKGKCGKTGRNNELWMGDEETRATQRRTSGEYLKDEIAGGAALYSVKYGRRLESCTTCMMGVRVTTVLGNNRRQL